MPRVESKIKGGGAERTCTTCGRVIPKGERYHTWAFRHGGRYFACAEHYPKRSQLTQSKLGEIYAAIEGQESNLGDISNLEDAEAAVNAVAEVVTQVADEYREAAEHFGGAGENAERADELEGWASELEGAAFDFDEDVLEGEECPECEGTGEVEVEGHDGNVGEAKCETCNGEGKVEDEEALEEALTGLRDEVQEFLNGCPL